MKLEKLTSGRRNFAVTGKCAMGIMMKTPRNGFSKTRLCPPLSSEEAASISRCFLKDTSAAIEALGHEDPFVVRCRNLHAGWVRGYSRGAFAARIQNNRSA